MQVAEKLRQDERLTVLDRTNLRYLTAEALGNPARLDIATLDLSFISVLKVMPAVCDLLSPTGQLVVLIKPQFEAGKSQVCAHLYSAPDYGLLWKMDVPWCPLERGGGRLWGRVKGDFCVLLRGSRPDHPVVLQHY